MTNRPSRPSASKRKLRRKHGFSGGSPFAPPDAVPLSPDPSASLAAVILSKPTNHPTIYRKRIRSVEGDPRAGDWVAVYQEANESGQPELFAYGLFNPKSEVAVRLVRWSGQMPVGRG